MADSVLKHSIGLLIVGIKNISSLIQEYNLRNENVLSLHREILNLKPCIESLKLSYCNSGLHNRLQRLLILMEEIKIWLEAFATKSCLRHFFFALIHKKEINKFYIRIQELKMEMGFDMKVDSHIYQQNLAIQMNELIDKLKTNIDFEQIKQVIDIQKNMFELKFENHLSIIQNIDLKYSKLISEYEVELDEMKQKTYEMQYKINTMEQSMQEMNEKIILLENCRKCNNNKKEYLDFLGQKIEKKFQETEKEMLVTIDTKINNMFLQNEIKMKQIEYLNKFVTGVGAGESKVNQVFESKRKTECQQSNENKDKEINKKIQKKSSNNKLEKLGLPFLVDACVNTIISYNLNFESNNIAFKIYNYIENN
jgi:hypothetical protein